MSKIIALDAGHGMQTAGKRCLKSIDPNETREWWLNGRIADRVQELLAEYDCTVLRVDDTTGAKDISLSARVKAANAAKADMYISIHHNAGIKGGKGGGTVVYYCSSKPERPTQAQRLYDAVTSRTGLVGNRSSKVIKNGFYVIKNTTMPAFLIENGFMDSQTDTPIILTSGHAEKTAQGIVSFLAAELKLTAKETPAQEQVILSTTGNTSYVTVKSGDTLSKIAKRFGINWQELAKINGISAPYTIRAGQIIYLKPSLCYPAYTGRKTTLTAALASLRIDSSYSNRKKIAVANGITGYLGTASQNTAIYNLLTAGLLRKVQ